MRLERLVIAAACVLAAACNDPIAPAALDQAVAFDVTGGGGGNPHFFFLPPITSQAASFSGAFDGSLDPVVDICRLDKAGVDCVAPVAHLTSESRGFGDDDDDVRRGRDSYTTKWRPWRFQVDKNSVYRICVSVGPSKLGHVDVTLTDNDGWRREGDRSKYARMRHDRTLRVAFRIEAGATDAGTAGDQACDSAMWLGSISGAKCLVGADLPIGSHERRVRCAGIADWPITLIGTDDQGQAVSLTATTNDRGRYAFSQLRPGTYTVCEGTKLGFRQVYPAAGASCTGGTFGFGIVLSSGENVRHQNFGNQQVEIPPPPVTGVGRIEGLVFISNTTIGSNGWAVFLFDASGSTLVAQTVTDGSGAYFFADVPVGTYLLCEDHPAFLAPEMQTTPKAGDPGTALCTNGLTGYVVTIVAAGQLIVGRDFANALQGLRAQ